MTACPVVLRLMHDQAAGEPPLARLGATMDSLRDGREG